MKKIERVMRFYSYSYYILFRLFPPVLLLYLFYVNIALLIFLF